MLLSLFAIYFIDSRLNSAHSISFERIDANQEKKKKTNERTKTTATNNKYKNVSHNSKW